MKALLALVAAVAATALSAPAAFGQAFVTDTLAPGGGSVQQGYYDPMTSTYYKAGTGPAVVAEQPSGYDARAYVPGGAPDVVARAIQFQDHPGLPETSPTLAHGGSSSAWPAIGAGSGAALLLLLGSALVLTRRRPGKLAV